MPVGTIPTFVLRGKAIIDTVHTYSLNKAKSDALDAANKLLREDILAAMDGQSVASCGTHIVRVTETEGTPGRDNIVITTKMVGQVIPGSKGRAGSTRLEVI